MNPPDERIMEQEGNPNSIYKSAIPGYSRAHTIVTRIDVTGSRSEKARDALDRDLFYVIARHVSRDRSK